MKKDPKLLERRLNAGPGAEKQKRQRTIQFFASLGFISTIVVPAIDHRFRWSHLSTSLVIAGNVLVASGFLIIFRVFQENTFTSGVIEIDHEQKVISTGPYAIVRHPMYLGALIMLLGIPLALGSSWGLLTMIPMTYVIVWRLLEEEEFLAKNLPGYAEYRNKVRYRLMPYIW
jgi:protein-S-isoprenylcysteine O-methyltransferase Ste14